MRTPLLLLAFMALNVSAQVHPLNKMMQGRMGQGGGDVKVEDDKDPFVPNSFIGSFRMEMHSYKNGEEVKQSPTNMHYWSTAEKTLMKTETPDAKGQDMQLLTDLKGKWQYVMMTDDKGKKTAMKSHKKKITMKEDGERAKPEITITDETKLIDGHSCRKVIVKNDDGTWTGWVTEDMQGPFGDMMRNVKNADPEMMRRMSELKGMALEYEWVSTDGKDKIVCYMHDVVIGTVDESVFSLDGYEVTEMPSFGQ